MTQSAMNIKILIAIHKPYWILVDPVYLPLPAGLVHYRRNFTPWKMVSVDSQKDQILTAPDWEKLLRNTPVVVADELKYYIETNRSHYDHTHIREGLDVTK